MQAAGSAVTAVLKKAILVVRKSCDNYHEKAVIAIMKKLSQLSGKAVCFGQWVLSGCWEGYFNIYFIDLAKNGKISLKGILLFLV